ncbi:hypothetical protein PIB30_089101 [Stylosanthes scabra]|uniref:Uncharacterized protein n=1 Tax=Stylosanthes scabra TaxID=79078 RepID=A0ABU6QWA5_9FABA|nr:hypothetical protein [Stylosanthes scabra]
MGKCGRLCAEDRGERALHRRTDTAAPSRSSAVDAPSRSSAVDASSPSPFAHAFTADLLVPSPFPVDLVFKDRRRRTSAIDTPSPFARAFTADLLAPSPATVDLVFKDCRRRTRSLGLLRPPMFSNHLVQVALLADLRSSTILFWCPCSPIFVPSSDHVLPQPFASPTVAQPPFITIYIRQTASKSFSDLQSSPPSATSRRNISYHPSSCKSCYPMFVQSQVLNSEAPLKIHRRFGPTTVDLLCLSSAAIRVTHRSPASVHYHLHPSDSVEILFRSAIVTTVGHCRLVL